MHFVWGIIDWGSNLPPHSAKYREFGGKFLIFMKWFPEAKSEVFIAGKYQPHPRRY